MADPLWNEPALDSKPLSMITLQKAMQELEIERI